MASGNPSSFRQIEDHHRYRVRIQGEADPLCLGTCNEQRDRVTRSYGGRVEIITFGQRQ